MSIVGDIAGAIGLVKQAKDLADQMKNLELKAVIVDLQSKLLDLKEEINGLQEQNTRLEEEVKRLSAPPEVTIKDGMYYKGEDGPFCVPNENTRHSRQRIRGKPSPHWKDHPDFDAFIENIAEYRRSANRPDSVS